MKTLVMVLMAIAGFMIVDGYYRQEIKRINTTQTTTVRYITPTDLFDEQFSSRYEQMGSLFDSSGPWMYRDDLSARGALNSQANPEAERKTWRLVSGHWKLVDKDGEEPRDSPDTPPPPPPMSVLSPGAPGATTASLEAFDPAQSCRGACATDPAAAARGAGIAAMFAPA